MYIRVQTRSLNAEQGTDSKNPSPHGEAQAVIIIIIIILIEKNIQSKLDDYTANYYQLLFLLLCYSYIQYKHINEHNTTTVPIHSPMFYILHLPDVRRIG